MSTFTRMCSLEQLRKGLVAGDANDLAGSEKMVIQDYSSGELGRTGEVGGGGGGGGGVIFKFTFPFLSPLLLPPSPLSSRDAGQGYRSYGNGWEGNAVAPLLDDDPRLKKREQIKPGKQGSKKRKRKKGGKGAGKRQRMY